LIGFARVSDFEKANRLYEGMKSRKIKPDATTFTILVDMYGKNDNLEKAEFFLSEAISQGIKDSQLFTSLINVYARKNMLAEAESTYKKMLNLQIKPSAATYNVLIRMYANANMVDKVDVIFGELMRTEAVNPDMITFTALMNAFGKHERWDSMKKVLTLMAELGYKPSLNQYESVVNGYRKIGKPDMAWRVIGEMAELANLTPYSEMVSGLVSDHLQAQQYEQAVQTMKKARSIGARMDEKLYLTTLQTLCTENKWDEATQLLHEMASDRQVHLKETVGHLVSWIKESNNTGGLKKLKISLQEIHL